MKKPYFSIYIPTYNNSSTIADTLNSVFRQTYTNFEVIIRDDGSKDSTLRVVKKFKDPRLTIHKNPINLGYSANLNMGLKDCQSDIIFLLAGDDLIDVNTLRWYSEAFKQNPSAGAITRPYYWFDSDYTVPVRTKQTTQSKKDLVVKIDSSFDKVLLVFSSLDQCSGLCFKRSLTKMEFGRELWVSHAYPWLDIFKNNPVIFLKKYPLAVRIGHSTTRTNIYQKSPMIYWKEMMEYVFPENKFTDFRNKIITNFIGINYVGLVQVKNYGSFKSYIREVWHLITFNKMNLLSYKFWLFFLITLITPRSLLRVVSDKYKSVINRHLVSRDMVINLD
jgi:glycosyltransferase involved in cell wall biosynthesis